MYVHSAQFFNVVLMIWLSVPFVIRFDITYGASRPWEKKWKLMTKVWVRWGWLEIMVATPAIQFFFFFFFRGDEERTIDGWLNISRDPQSLGVRISLLSIPLQFVLNFAKILALTQICFFGGRWHLSTVTSVGAASAQIFSFSLAFLHTLSPG